MQSLNAHRQVLQLLHQPSHVLLGPCLVLVTLIRAAISTAPTARVLVRHHHIVHSPAQLKVQLGQSLLLLAYVRHLVHRSSAAERTQLARVEVVQQTQQRLLHVPHIGNFG